MTNKIILDTACHKGQQLVIRHESHANQTLMDLAIFLPSKARYEKVPALIYLSGLTCTWENAVTKAGAQYFAEKQGIAIIYPDTSPRGEHIADDTQYDLGQGAGFYVNATQKPWQPHYQMYDYVKNDIINLIQKQKLPIRTEFFALCGHSMGGHGALTIALKNPDIFISTSAFAPIVNPIDVAWGQKAFTHYLGEDQTSWQDYDACQLVAQKGYPNAILIHQGLADQFYLSQLYPQSFVDKAKQKQVNVQLEYAENYDHSYYFIASFIEQHIDFHCQFLI